MTKIKRTASPEAKGRDRKCVIGFFLCSVSNYFFGQPPREPRAMPNPPPKLASLQHIVNNLHSEPLKKGPMTESQLQELRLIRGKIGPSGIVGVRVEAAEAVNELAEAIFNDPRYGRGTTFATVVNQLIDVVISSYSPKATMQPADVDFIEQKMADWLQKQIAVHEFYIPCFLAPWPAPAFSIGPVRFTHVQEFAAAAKVETGAMFDVTFGDVFQHMGRVGANWIATVQVDCCTKERAQEIANLAADIALGGLQLCISEDGAQHMARMTGRTMPVFHHAVSRSNGQLSSASTNSQPGLAFGPYFLDRRLAEARPVLDSIGARVRTFVTGGGGPISELEQAWADAAYWFHEGLAEPLDTIAVPKLETALEVLLRSESTSGSKARVLKAIRAFHGKEPGDFINPQSQVTVEQFAKGFVRDRSRVLHGTWSTLVHSLRGSRPSLTLLVRELLALYTLALDQFAVTASPSDDIEAFLNFIDGLRKTSALSASTTTANE